MKHRLLALSTLLVAATACVESTVPETAPTFRLTATVTEDNVCTVTVLGKTYTSTGNVVGDVPTKFVGTVRDKTYHGFGCWVGTDDGDGTLVVLFSGNNFGKPLEAGSYPLRLEILDDTPLRMAAVNFRGSHFGEDKLRTNDNSVGNVTVVETPSGGRRIVVDVEVVRWGPLF